MIQRTLEILLPVFLLIAAGYVFGRRKTFPHQEISRLLAEFVFIGPIPALIFLSMSRVRVERLYQPGFLAAYSIALLLSAGFNVFLVSVVFRRSRKVLPICVMNAAVTNSAYVGLPIMMLAYGDVLSVILVMTIQILIVTPLVLFSLERMSSDPAIGRTIATSLWSVIQTPIVLAAIFGILWSALGLSVPALGVKTLELLGGAAIPTALIALGLSLSAQHDQHSTRCLTKSQYVEIFTSVAIKLVAQPFLAYVLGRYFLNISASMLGPLVIMAGMPSAVNGFIFAQRYGVYVEESTASIALTTVLSLFSLSIILTFLLP